MRGTAGEQLESSECWLQSLGVLLRQGNARWSDWRPLTDLLLSILELSHLYLFLFFFPNYTTNICSLSIFEQFFKI